MKVSCETLRAVCVGWATIGFVLAQPTLTAGQDWSGDWDYQRMSLHRLHDVDALSVLVIVEPEPGAEGVIQEEGLQTYIETRLRESSSARNCCLKVCTMGRASFYRTPALAQLEATPSRIPISASRTSWRA